MDVNTGLLNKTLLLLILSVISFYLWAYGAILYIQQLGEVGFPAARAPLPLATGLLAMVICLMGAAILDKYGQ